MKKNIQKELLHLLKQIIEIDTCYPPGSSKVFGKFVMSYLKNSGLRIKSYGVDKEKINSSLGAIVLSNSTSGYFKLCSIGAMKLFARKAII